MHTVFLQKLVHYFSVLLAYSLGSCLPSAFHANEGATRVRRLYLERMALRWCYSFQNRRKLFDIHRSFKFALVVASRTGPTVSFPCAFYLHDDEWLFGEPGDRKLLYTLDLVRRTGGEYLEFDSSSSSKRDLDVKQTFAFEKRKTLWAGLRTSKDSVRGSGRHDS